MKTVYVCETCDRIHDSKNEATKCESSHEKFYRVVDHCGNCYYHDGMWCNLLYRRSGSMYVCDGYVRVNVGDK